jgi:hypothetical protein
MGSSPWKVGKLVSDYTQCNNIPEDSNLQIYAIFNVPPRQLCDLEIQLITLAPSAG